MDVMENYNGVQLPNPRGLGVGEINADIYASDQWVATFPGSLLSGMVEKDELMDFIRGKSQESLQRIDEPQQKENYIFWRIMELFCNWNRTILMAEIALCLFKCYSCVRKKVRWHDNSEDWCLPLARRLCSSGPDDETRQAVLKMADDLAYNGQIFASQICCVVARLELGTYKDSSFDLIGCTRVSLPLKQKDLREAIVRAEVYEYVLFMTSGVIQPKLQEYKVLHASVLAMEGLIVLALGYCKSIVKAVTVSPSSIDTSLILEVLEMSKDFCKGMPEEPEWLRSLRQLLAARGHKENKTFLRSGCAESPAIQPSPLQLYRTAEDVFHSLYSIGEKLGQGGFGSVFAGIRLADGKNVAIKYVKKSANEDYITIPGERCSLPVEIALMKMVSVPPCSENIVQLLEWLETPTYFILVLERPSPCMDLIQFRQLHNGRLPEWLARHIMWQVAQAVRHCFQRRVLHRDIKLENLLINTETLQVKLIDFGCGDVLVDSFYTQIAGTRIYFPPEWTLEGQYLGQPATIWSLGMLQHEMIYGDSFQLPPNVSGECWDLIRWCLVEDPYRRATIDDIINHQWFKGTHQESGTKSRPDLEATPDANLSAELCEVIVLP